MPAILPSMQTADQARSAISDARMASEIRATVAE
jgi:hypothetical protein